MTVEEEWRLKRYIYDLVNGIEMIKLDPLIFGNLFSNN